jgi:hypothetical protein
MRQAAEPVGGGALSEVGQKDGMAAEVLMSRRGTPRLHNQSGPRHTQTARCQTVNASGWIHAVLIVSATGGPPKSGR